MASINSNFSVTPVYNGCVGGEGPLSVQAFFSGQLQQKVKFDLTYLKDTQGFSGVQCVFLDNSEGDGNLFLQVEETGQIIKCSPKMQGYFPILVPERARFKVWHEGTGTSNAPIYFLNFSIAQGQW